MRKWVDGQYADMTAEEIAAIQTPPEISTTAPPSTEERLEALEAAMLELICGGSE
mgnify:FL=1